LTEPADALYWLALEAIPGLGPDTARRLLARFPTPADIFAAPVGLLKPIVGDQIAAALSTPVRPDDHQETLDWLAAPDAHLITWNDPDYPETLRNMPDAPAWLYVKGQRAVLRRPMLAIVGSRTATAQGKRDAQAFAQALAEAGLTIVSGLADGIDAAAHEGGLAGNGAGVAVVALAWTEFTRPRIGTWPIGWRQAARWSPSSPLERRPGPVTSRAATGLSAVCRSACWSSRPRPNRAR